jgi:hypothetical protein
MDAIEPHVKRLGQALSVLYVTRASLEDETGTHFNECASLTVAGETIVDVLGWKYKFHR